MEQTPKKYKRFLRKLVFHAFLAVSFLPFSAYANVNIGPPPPQKVLIISNGGGSSFITNLATQLTCAGATVTIVTVTASCLGPALSAAGLPTTGAGLAAAFDQVWDVRWPNGAGPSSPCSGLSGPYTTPGTDEYILKDYLANRGSLYEMFEYIDLAKYNALIDFMNNVVSLTSVFPTQLSAVDPWILNIPEPFRRK